MTPVFITGIGTGIGKTIVSAIVCNALDSDYWKPIQSGNIEGTDSEFVAGLLNTNNTCLPEVYNLTLPASPHLAARNENIIIDTNLILEQYRVIEQRKPSSKYLVIEGAGGLLVPLNEHEFVLDMILKLKAKVILVSRNYLGSINHSLLTAAVCKQRGADVAGWIFNDDYMSYPDEIARWSGFPVIGSIPKLEEITVDSLSRYALLFREKLSQLL